MAKRRNLMSEGKKNIIAALIQEYDIQSAKDIQDALKDLLGGTIQSMLEAEMDQHLGYKPYERTDNTNSRNGNKPKSIRSKYGEMEIDVPQDRDSTFEPQIVKKRQKDISGIEEKTIAMYAKGLTTRQISDQIEDIYGFEVSKGMVSDITNKLLPGIEEWQQRPLASIYPIVFIDAVVFSVMDSNVIKKLAAYIILGVNEEGQKEVLSISIGQNESSKYWLSVLNDKDLEFLFEKGIKHMQSEARWQIAELIGRKNNISFKKYLLNLLDDSNKYVQRRALISLDRIDTEKAQEIAFKMFLPELNVVELLKLRDRLQIC